jgi:hypothetical protein
MCLVCRGKKLVSLQVIGVSMHTKSCVVSPAPGRQFCVKVNFPGHSRNTCVRPQHAACFKSPFGAWNLDIAHRFWKGGVDLQVSEAGWHYFALSLVRSAVTRNAPLTTGHNASSASCCVNFRVYLTSKLSTVRVLRIRSNSVEILQYDPALCISINCKAVTSILNSS